MTRQKALSDAKEECLSRSIGKKYDFHTEVSEVDRVIAL